MTPQNTDWEEEFDENWPTLYGPLTVGALESAYDVRNELKSFIRTKKREWDIESFARGYEQCLKDNNTGVTFNGKPSSQGETKEENL